MPVGIDTLSLGGHQSLPPAERRDAKHAEGAGQSVGTPTYKRQRASIDFFQAAVAVEMMGETSEPRLPTAIAV